MNPSEFDDAYDDCEKLRGAILTETIKNLHPKPPLTCSPETSVLDAARIMNQNHGHCLCVLEGERLVGIFTERDVLRKVVEQGLDVKKTPVGELMTRNPECLTFDDKIAFALNMMHVGGYRNIPIFHHKRLTGIVSIADIAEFMVEIFPEGALNVPPDSSHEISLRPDGG